jgi:hypothetical protein
VPTNTGNEARDLDHGRQSGYSAIAFENRSSILTRKGATIADEIVSGCLPEILEHTTGRTDPPLNAGDVHR